MAVSVRITIEARGLRRELEQLQRRRLPRFRRRLTEDVLRGVLAAVIARHPVDTGRARNAWAAALAQVGGVTAGGAGEGLVTRRETEHTAEAAATNRVKYIVYLEDGTRRMKPFFMVKKSLAEAGPLTAGRAAALFREELS